VRVVTFLAVALLHFCSPTPMLNLLANGNGIAPERDIAYGPGPRHGLDVYAPISAAGAPVVVFFYGGGWVEGDKSWYRFIGVALAERGVVVVIPDYRLHPAVKFPAFLEDAAAATAWTRANVVRYGGDPRRIFLMGNSAGGQIAALLALDPGYLRAVGMSRRQDICGLIGLAGAYDYTPANPAEFAAIFGPEADWPGSRPINYVTAQSPPMLLETGDSDSTVEPGNTTRLAARLRAHGVDVVEDIYPGISHGALLAAFGRPLVFLAPAREAALRFIAAHGACGE
jgi:acetyl esterase/lipase